MEHLIVRNGELNKKLDLIFGSLFYDFLFFLDIKVGESFSW